jgi:hypothetical protein
MPLGKTGLCLWIDDIEATLYDLKPKGLDVDPDGVRIELMQLMPESCQAEALHD